VRPEVGFLRSVVEAYSPTGSTTQAAGVLQEFFESRGMPAELQEGMLVVNPEAASLMLLGHMDTVEGNLDVRYDGRFLTGRGTSDAKGPLCAAAWALASIPEAWPHVRLVAVPDEEGDSRSARRISSHWGPMPCVILEPTGWQGIGISYRGRRLLRCTTASPEHHASSPETSAVEKMFSVWQRLSENATARILSISGGSTECSALIDVRYSDTDPRDALPDDCSAEVAEHIPPYRAEKNTPLVRTFLRSVRESGGRPVFKKKGGTSDMNILGNAWRDQILAYGPGDGGLAHTNRERIAEEDYIRGISVIKQAIMHFLEKTEKK